VNIGGYDGIAKTLPASRTNLAVFLRRHMFGKRMRLLWLRRMRLAFAFDLARAAISWKLGVGRGCDASVPPQAGMS
jgi:hypothetical protein